MPTGGGRPTAEVTPVASAVSPPSVRECRPGVQRMFVMVAPVRGVTNNHPPTHPASNIIGNAWARPVHVGGCHICLLYRRMHNIRCQPYPTLRGAGSHSIVTGFASGMHAYGYCSAVGISLVRQPPIAALRLLPLSPR